VRSVGAARLRPLGSRRLGPLDSPAAATASPPISPLSHPRSTRRPKKSEEDEEEEAHLAGVASAPVREGAAVAPGAGDLRRGGRLELGFSFLSLLNTA